MTQDKVERAAKILAEAWLAAKPATSFPDELRATTRAEAFAIQDAMARIIDQPVSGWKLGATSPAMRRRAGHDGAIIGRVFESVTYQSPARLPADRFPHARVECEFAFRMLESVPVRSDPWPTAELSERATLHLALEIIGNRYPKLPDAPKPSTLDEVADNGAGIGFVFGAEVPDWQHLDLKNLEIDIRVDANPSAENFLGIDRCMPVEALVEAANTLSERGIVIEAGQYVSTGAATDPQPVVSGSRVVARFGHLGIIEAEFVP